MKTSISLGSEKKFYLSLLILFIGIQIGFSQTTSIFDCDFDAPFDSSLSEQWCDSEFSKSTDPAYLATFDPVVINIHFWRIVQDNGVAGFDHISENDALLAISQINRELNQYKIFFKYKGLKDIPISQIYIPQNPAYLNSFISNYNGPIEIEKADSFNMYIPYDYVEAYAGAAIYSNTRSQIKREQFAAWGMLHELGHNLGLFHPFRFYQGNVLEGCEHVTRNPLHPNYNADTNGDRVTDTAATLILRGYNTNDQTCLYTGNDSDCQLNAYQIFNEDVRNYMNYVPEVPACEKVFSLGQGIRMRESLDIDCYNNYAAVKNTVASLYEPYKGEYYFAGPIDPNALPPYFQPGFDYRFVECQCYCPQPSAYGDTSFTYNNLHIVKSVDADETDYASIYHPNHSAIRILQLENGTTQPRRCYNNYNWSPNGGKVTRFNDGVFNTNVTITPHDSTGINNPNLINNLESGLYKIEKDYNDGSTEEVIILKGNN